LLRREGIRLAVNDLGSANGTYVNGQRLTSFQKHVVAHGDHLILGRLHLIISFGAAELE
jgi:pSer/pThr/pTyr-binding forkhead associated (FHA) protein